MGFQHKNKLKKRVDRKVPSNKARKINLLVISLAFPGYIKKFETIEQPLMSGFFHYFKENCFLFLI